MLSVFVVFISLSAVGLVLSALLQLLRNKMPIKRLEINKEIFVIGLCFGFGECMFKIFVTVGVSFQN